MGGLIMMIKNVKTTKNDEYRDQEVEEMVNDEKSWEKKTNVQPKTKPTSIRLSTRTIERAKFFAKIHHERGYQSWIKKIVEERVNTEYEMYKRLKNEVV
jgi:predicted DNA binding CopG/RHH family protein